MPTSNQNNKKQQLQKVYEKLFSCTKKGISFDEMDCMYKAAGITRMEGGGGGILKYEKWEFDGSFNLENNVPEELINFFRWILAGPVTFDQVLKEGEVKRISTRLTHSTIYETFVNRQYKDAAVKDFQLIVRF